MPILYVTHDDARQVKIPFNHLKNHVKDDVCITINKIIQGENCHYEVNTYYPPDLGIPERRPVIAAMFARQEECMAHVVAVDIWLKDILVAQEKIRIKGRSWRQKLYERFSSNIKPQSVSWTLACDANLGDPAGHDLTLATYDMISEMPGTILRLILFTGTPACLIKSNAFLRVISTEEQNLIRRKGDIYGVAVDKAKAVMTILEPSEIPLVCHLDDQISTASVSRSRSSRHNGSIDINNGSSTQQILQALPSEEKAKCSDCCTGIYAFCGGGDAKISPEASSIEERSRRLAAQLTPMSATPAGTPKYRPGVVSMPLVTQCSDADADVEQRKKYL